MISVKISKAVMQDPAKLRRVAQPLALARVMAEAMEQRVRSGGKTATPVKPYATHVVERRRAQTKTSSGNKTKLGYVISPYYADKLGVGVDRFESSAAMHARAGVRLGTFRATGGMWSGLQVRNFGLGAVIEFAGVSLGKASHPPNITFRTGKVTDVTERETKRRGAAVAAGKTLGKDRDLVESNGRIFRQERKARRDKKGQTVQRKSPQMIRNWQKAGVVFKHSRVNVIQPTDDETRAMIDGLGAALFDATIVLSTGSIETSTQPTTALAERFHRALSPR